nr:7-deoxyloganetin glucosyltransferase [Quercus suber]
MSLSASLWKEDSKCLQWLDKRELNSIMYVNYGNVTMMTKQNFNEFAWGLANSKHAFLWAVRPDMVMGDSTIVPEEFFEETKDRGLLASWCPQDKVLAYPPIGVYLTHCGWNSTLESEIGVEVNDDVKRDEIEALVKEMMEGDKGKAMRQWLGNGRRKQ